ncbi:hypothetical protein GOBAR_AA10477 [Gossypium barbadense]|uniref:Uncharacterized protein n=1 Tax=Gossypium barbadense TaxID=3634 RepID=A0A2P5Y3J0_GOSBA|nr:hypothetical protein GOBAR_AA10477 [Gossypium barbadense]
MEGSPTCYFICQKCVTIMEGDRSRSESYPGWYYMEFGYGSYMDFWRDYWVKDWGPLINVCTQSEKVPTEHVPFQNMVKLSGEWNWSAISSALLSQVLLSISTYNAPSVFDVDNFIGWWHEKRSTFSICSAYSTNCGMEIAKSSTFGIKFGIIWDLKRQLRILTNENRVRRHLTSDSSCKICRTLFLWIRRNNYVFNANFVENGSVLEKSYRMREYYLASNRGLVPLRHTSYKTCRIGYASASGLIRDKHGR